MARVFAFVFACALTVVTARASRAAESAGDFFRRNGLTLQVGSGPAGGYDVVGRLVARFMSAYLPGHPAIVVQNVPGGGSLVLANQFANTTRADGSVFGVMNSGMATTPLLEPEAAHFDPRAFHFLGSPSSETEVLIAAKDAPVRDVGDIFKTRLIVGASSPGSATFDIPFLTNALLGTKFQIVPGYQDSAQIKLAMGRGEVQGDAALGLSSLRTQFADVWKSGSLKVIAQYGFSKDPALPDAPLFPMPNAGPERQILDVALARSSYGQPFVTPPGVPSDRVAILRDAFERTLRDPQFLAAAARAHVEIDPIPGPKLEALTRSLFDTPPAVLARLRALIAQEKR